MQLDTMQNSKDLADKIQAISGQIQEVIARKDRVDNEQDLEKLEQEVQLLTRTLGAVSYTHLDVYKRQAHG